MAVLERAATDGDVPAVAACLADAFFEDPLWGHWTFPDESTRPARILRFMTFWAGCGVRNPWTRMTEQAGSVAVWLPPGEPELTAGETVTFRQLLDDLFGARAPEFDALFDQFDALHPHDEPHYYLSWWGTRRDQAGKGLGTALMHDNLARIDAEHMPAYLESTNPVNLPRYEALGFEARGTLGPPGGPVVTTMWRPAR